VPESVLKERHKVFLYTKTDHSYKPPGCVSSHIHSLVIGQTLSFKHTSICLGKITYPFDESICAITMIAVGAGVAPMIRILKALLDGDYGKDQRCPHVKKIHLLYGVRTVSDILQRELLDAWHETHSDRFQVCYCIGSRWANVTFAAKTAQRQEPPLPKDWETIPSDRKELGWVDGDKVARRGASNAQDEGHKIFICGLPGIYLSLCGKRTEPALEEGTQLHRLGYKDEQVIKF
jgi:2-polyprenylphenol hydroxylase and related flavodoxin oxidoreductases